MQVLFASFSPTQFSFSRLALRCLNSKCILHPFVHTWACWSKKEVCSGALLTHCYFEELKIFFWLFKVRVSRKRVSGQVHNARSLCLLHTGMCSRAQTCQILKMKELQCKIILLCRLQKYKKYHTCHNG